MTFWNVALWFALYVIGVVYVLFRGDFHQGPLWQRVLMRIFLAHVSVAVGLFICGVIMFGLLPLWVGNWIFGEQRFAVIVGSMIGSLLAICGLYLACGYLSEVWDWMRRRTSHPRKDH